MLQLNDFILGVGTGIENYNELVFKCAIQNNFTFFDCANMYPTQRNVVGKAIKNLKKNRKFNRNKVFISSKLNMNEMGMVRKFDWEQFGNDIIENTKKALHELNISYLDLMLIHWPLRINPKTGQSEEFIIEEIWPYMEELVNLKIVRYIGVSNFGLLELHRLLNICHIKPYVNEIEFHPYQTNQIVIDFCKNNNINIIGSSPYAFGCDDRYIIQLLNEPILKKIAEKYTTTSAIVVLQWNIENGVFPIPGTSKIEHLLDWKKVGTFTLCKEEIEEINNLHKDIRLYDNEVYGYHKLTYYPQYSFYSYSCLVGNKNDNTLKLIDTTMTNFLKLVHDSITIGPGFVILKDVFQDHVNKIKQIVDSYDGNEIERWDGFDTECESIVNQDPVFIELINNPLVGLIVETLLGWDCLIDNCSFSTSRPAPNNTLFGPHIDSPFEQHPGAFIPPHTYPVVLQCIHCVDDFTKDNGALFVIPHSHKNRQRIHFTSQNKVKTGVVPSNAIPVEAEKGDVIIALGNLWHGALVNNTKEKRRGILIEYISSIIEPRDRYNDRNIKEEIYKHFPRRVVRLFSGGKDNFHSRERLFFKWRKLQ